jgi:hypothetical protein
VNFLLVAMMVLIWFLIEQEDSCPAAPLVSFRINRQLSGWSLPP